MTENKPKHYPTGLIVHAVPFGSGGLTALCGESLGRGGHTGRFGNPARQVSGDQHPCAACASMAVPA